jgi:hypothetical protein
LRAPEPGKNRKKNLTFVTNAGLIWHNRQRTIAKACIKFHFAVSPY